MLKKLSKKRGFTIVEVLVAFVVFAIMAAMVSSILQTTMKVKQENLANAAAIEAQKQAYYQQAQPISKDNYTALKTAGANYSDDLDLKLGGTDYPIGFVAADPTGSKENFELEYYIGQSGNEPWIGSTEDSDGNGNGSDVFGDLNYKIYGSKGIGSITISMLPRTDGANRYNVFIGLTDNNTVDSAQKPFQTLRITFPYEIVNYGCVYYNNGADDAYTGVVEITKSADGKTMRLSGDGSSQSIFNLSGSQRSPFWVELASPLTTEQLQDMTKIFGDSGKTTVTKDNSATTAYSSADNYDATSVLYRTTFYQYVDPNATGTGDEPNYINIYAAIPEETPTTPTTPEATP